MAILEKTFQNLYQEVGSYLKNDRTLADATDLAECKRIVNDGYLMFLSERDWSFLCPEDTITIRATGTATCTTIVTTTITVSAAFFYDSMVGHTIAFTLTGNTYTIASVTSTTVAVMTASAAGETSTDTITFTADGRYTLPSYFGGLVETFSYDTSNPYGGPRKSSPPEGHSGSRTILR